MRIGVIKKLSTESSFQVGKQKQTIKAHKEKLDIHNSCSERNVMEHRFAVVLSSGDCYHIDYRDVVSSGALPRTHSNFSKGIFSFNKICISSIENFFNKTKDHVAWLENNCQMRNAFKEELAS